MSQNHPHDNIYNILGKLQALEPTPAEVVREKAQAIRESVESQGSILAGLREVSSTEQRLSKMFAEESKPDYIDLDKDGNKKESMKKAAADKKKKESTNESLAECAMCEEGTCTEHGAFEEGHIHKGTYGTSYDPSDEEKKDKPKHVPRKGETGARTKAERQAAGDAAPDLDTSHLGSNPFSQKVVKQPKVWKGPSREISGARSDDTTNADDTGDTPEQRAKKLKAKFKKTGKIGEVITKKTSAGDIIHDFQKSKNPKFSGKSKEQRKNQALGAYYGMHPEKSNKSESLRESLERVERKVILEANLKELMKQHHMTMDEMLEQLRNEAQTYKQSGHMSEMLRDCMEIHNHNKNFSLPHPAMADEGTELPKPQGTLGTIGSAIKHGAKQVGKAIVGKSDDELLHDLHKDVNGPDAIDRNFPSAQDELNEIAKLAGLGEELRGEYIDDKKADAKAHGKHTAHAFGQDFEVDESSLEEGPWEFKNAADRTAPDEHIKIDGKDTGRIKHEDAMQDQAGVSLNELAKLAGLTVPEQNMGPGTGGMEEGKHGEDLESLIKEYVHCMKDAIEQANLDNDEGAEMADYNAEEVWFKIRELGGDQALARAEQAAQSAISGQDDWHDSLDGEREDPHGWDLDEADAPVVEPKTKPVNDAEHTEYRSMRGSTMGPGEGDPGEKRMYPPSGGAAPGADNGMTEPARKMPIKDGVKESALESRLAAEYESIKRQK